jgi:hypothetical protein
VSDVFYARTDDIDLGALRAAWEGRLTPDERQRLATLQLPRDQRDYLAAHVLLRLALHEVRAADPEPDPASDRRGWSLTHANGLVACAVATHQTTPIGVDTEHRSAAVRLETMVDTFLTSSEIALLPSDPDDRAARMVEIWTAKEALLKARGEGFSGDSGFGVLRRLESTPLGKLDGWATISVRDTRTGAACSALGCWVEGYALSVVVIEGKGGAPRLTVVKLQ